MPRHSVLTGSALHEPKDISGASANEVYIADGAGSGSWADKDAYTTTYWDDMLAVLSSAKAGATSPPDFAQINDDGSGSTGVFAWLFDATSEEELFFTIQIPHRYLAGSDIKPHIHWEASDATAGNVVWGLEYCISNNGVAAGATTLVSVTDAAPGAALTQQIVSFPDIDGSSLVESSILNCRIFRDASNAADTYAADAAALSCDFHIQIEKPGTLVEYPGA